MKYDVSQKSLRDFFPNRKTGMNPLPHPLPWELHDEEILQTCSENFMRNQNFEISV